MIAHTWPSLLPLGPSAAPCCPSSDQPQSERETGIITNKNTDRNQLRTSSLGIYLSFKLFDNVSEEVLVKVFSTKEGVSVRGLHLKYTLLDLQDRDVKRTPAKIIHSNTISTNKRGSVGQFSPFSLLYAPLTSYPGSCPGRRLMQQLWAH